MHFAVKYMITFAVTTIPNASTTTVLLGLHGAGLNKVIPHITFGCVRLSLVTNMH